jgi:hypothetical protein
MIITCSALVGNSLAALINPSTELTLLQSMHALKFAGVGCIAASFFFYGSGHVFFSIVKLLKRVIAPAFLELSAPNLTGSLNAVVIGITLGFVYHAPIAGVFCSVPIVIALFHPGSGQITAAVINGVKGIITPLFPHDGEQTAVIIANFLVPITVEFIYFSMASIIGVFIGAVSTSMILDRAID